MPEWYQRFYQWQLDWNQWFLDYWIAHPYHWWLAIAGIVVFYCGYLALMKRMSK